MPWLAYESKAIPFSTLPDAPRAPLSLAAPYRRTLRILHDRMTV